MFGQIVTILLGFFLMTLGFAGVFLPFLPGAPIAWLGIFLYGYFTKFETISLAAILIFLGLVILTVVLDFIAPILGAKSYRASRYGIFGSFLGLLVGTFALGPIGIIVGPFVGAFLGELLSKKEPAQALKSSFGTLIGFLAGALIKTIIIFIMLGFFIYGVIMNLS